MFSGIIAVLAVHKINQFLICQTDVLPISHRTIQSHLQCFRHVFDGFPVGNAKLVIYGIQINPKRFGNHRIIKGLDGTLHIFHGFCRRLQRLRPFLLVVSLLLCPGNFPGSIHRHLYGYLLISIHRNLLITGKRLVLHIIRLFLQTVLVNRFAACHPYFLPASHYLYFFGFVGIISNRHLPCGLLFRLRYREHLPANALQLCNHVLFADVLLLHGSGIGC